jgi:hypothetical protein
MSVRGDNRKKQVAPLVRDELKQMGRGRRVCLEKLKKKYKVSYNTMASILSRAEEDGIIFDDNAVGSRRIYKACGFSNKQAKPVVQSPVETQQIELSLPQKHTMTASKQLAYMVVRERYGLKDDQIRDIENLLELANG